MHRAGGGYVMARSRSPNRDKAKQLYLDSRGKILLKDIAAALGVGDTQIRKWKSTDKWDDELKGTLPKRKSNVTNKKAAKNTIENEPIAREVIELSQNDDLNDKQKLFCTYYIKCFNATKAYYKAYKCSYETALTNGSALLKNTRVRDQIDSLKKNKLNRELLSSDDIFQKYIDIAFADITDYVVFGQEEVPVMGAFGPVTVKDEETGETIGLTKIVNTVKFKESVDVDGSLIGEVKQGKDGASIKLLDKMKALQWLADRFDLLTIEVQEKLKIERAKLGGGDQEKDRSGINEFIQATTMHENDIKQLFKGDEDG